MIDVGRRYVHIPVLLCADVKARDRTNHFASFLAGKTIKFK
jgi:hypothetical protein